MSTRSWLTGFISVIMLGWVLPTSAAGLIFHQGFETCWSTAKTKSQFLDSIRTSIDGTSACIPAQSGNQSGIAYTVCAAPNGCGTGVAGCAVSINAGTFSGNFLAGQFVGPGTAANITVPLTTSFFPSCSINLNAVALTYTLDYLMQNDGVDGVYSNDLMQPGVVINSYSLVNNNCDSTLFGLIGSQVSSAISAAEANASTAIEPDLRADTLDQSICPLTP